MIGATAIRSSKLSAKGAKQDQHEQQPKIVVYSQLCLGAGLASLVVAMTYRRVKKEHPSRHGPSRRSVELTRGGTPAHITEHIARIGDPEYICLSIAENKLTVRRKMRPLATEEVTAAGSQSALPPSELVL